MSNKIFTKMINYLDVEIKKNLKKRMKMECSKE